MKRRTVELVDYREEWAVTFTGLRDRLWPVLEGVAIAIEHVGSTSVPGLVAKPVVDLDVVIESREALAEAIGRLVGLGYEPRGNLGIPDREAFRTPCGEPAHHLYVCPRGSLALRNHLLLRDHFRAHATDREAYAALKRELARRHREDPEAYGEAKTAFLLEILARCGLTEAEIDEIRRANSR